MKVGNEQPITIGVAGGSGAGKTTVADAILSRLGPEHIVYVPYDAYYRDRSHLPASKRDRLNFDHPDALDAGLFIDHIRQLQSGQPIEMPVYDFKTHARTGEVRHTLPKRIILGEGILIFTEARLRALFDLRIFIETDSDIRFIRRLQRDVAERGRTVESVIDQWLQSVRPMHLEFVESTKRYAHIIIPDGLNEAALDLVLARLEGLLRHDISLLARDKEKVTREVEEMGRVTVESPVAR